MLIIIKLKKMILILKICFYQILKKNVTFVTLLLKHVDKKKKRICFFFHYGTKKKQFGGSQRSKLPINILKRGSITYFSINFTQHKNFYDFLTSDIVDDFFQSVYEVYHPRENKIQAFFEIINQQRGEVILEDNRAWLTNSFNTKDFNIFIRGDIENEIIKRIIVNGQSRISWFFKRFERLTIITTPANQIQLFSN